MFENKHSTRKASKSRCGDCGGDARLDQVIDRPQQGITYVWICGDCGRWFRDPEASA